MNMTLMTNMTDEQKEKYLSLKENQEIMYQVVCSEIRGCSHTIESQLLFVKLMELDSMMEHLENNEQELLEGLDDMDLQELKDATEENRETYKKVKREVN